MFVHLVVDGVAESSLGIGVDIVGAAARLLDVRALPTSLPLRTLRQRVVSLDGAPVRGGSGRPVAVDGAFGLRALGAGDVVVLPGIFGATEETVRALLARDDVVRLAAMLRRASARGATVAASCSATFVLASSGMLDGGEATTTWWLAPAFARAFPSVRLDVDRILVESEGVMTAGSAFAHADLMLALVGRVAGASVARMVAKYLVLEQRTSQSRFMVIEHLKVSDPAVRAAERFVFANLRGPLDVGRLARAAGVSPRTLARRIRSELGTTPNELVQRVRIAHAAHLLETTKLAVDEVAARVGYADAAAFRRVYRRIVGASPRGHR